MPRPLDDLYEDRIERIPESGCWIWMASADQRGYGKLTIRRRQFLAHRVLYERIVGPVPRDMECCHRCDLPSCVNPAHIFLGTHADNMADASAKGAMSSPLRRAIRTKPEIVQQILSSPLGQKPLARVLGISSCTVRRIRQRLSAEPRLGPGTP